MAGPGVSDGPNSRPLDDTVAQSGPGIPDDAASPGYDPVEDAEADAAEAAGRDRTPGRGDAKPPDADTLFNGP